MQKAIKTKSNIWQAKEIAFAYELYVRYKIINDKEIREYYLGGVC